MKKTLLAFVPMLALSISGFSACFAVCVDPDHDGAGDLYEVSTDDVTGEVTEVYDMSTTCMAFNGPYLLDCGLSGPIDEEVTTALMKLDVTAMRPPTPAEKIMFEAILKNGATRVSIDTKKLPASVVVYLRSH